MVIFNGNYYENEFTFNWVEYHLLPLGIFGSVQDGVRDMEGSGQDFSEYIASTFTSWNWCKPWKFCQDERPWDSNLPIADPKYLFIFIKSTCIEARQPQLAMNFQ